MVRSRERTRGGARVGVDGFDQRRPVRVRDALPVQVQFSAQPFADGNDLRTFIRRVRADPTLVNLDVVVAWAKRSGLSRLHSNLAAIRPRSGLTRLIVGIDEGGATRQGLELARHLFDQVYVFHDRSGRTFHPKVYLASGATRARLLVGSHNATAGGVYFNYEAGLDCILDLPADTVLLASVQDYIDRLLADTGLCKELSDAVLAELIANPRYKVGDEDARRKPSGAGSPEELDAEVDTDEVPGPAGAPPSLFGASAEPKKPDPGVSATAATAPAKKPPAKKAAPTKAPAKEAPAKKAVPTPGPGPTVAVQKRWFKQLSNSDAQHPPRVNSKVTGALRLNQADHPIDWRTYFRRDFFAGLNWHSEQSRNRRPIEYVMVPLHVTVNGQDLGDHVCRVDHAPHREQGQSNVPTDLKWGPLMPAMRANDYTGEFVILERLSDGSYRLEIAPADPGPGAFLP